MTELPRLTELPQMAKKVKRGVRGRQVAGFAFRTVMIHAEATLLYASLLALFAVPLWHFPVPDASLHSHVAPSTQGGDVARGLVAVRPVSADL